MQVFENEMLPNYLSLLLRRKISDEVGLPYTSFDLTNQQALSDAVEAHEAVLHIAGPFTKTGPPVVDACIKHGAHYMDITGETHYLTQVQVRSWSRSCRQRPFVKSYGLDTLKALAKISKFVSRSGEREVAERFVESRILC